LVPDRAIEAEPLNVYLLDAQSQYSGVFSSMINLFSLKFKDQELEREFQRKRDASYGQLAISLALLLSNFAILVLIDGTIIRSGNTGIKSYTFLGLYFLPFCLVIYGFVLLIYRALNNPRSLPWVWLRRFGRSLGTTLNPHLFAVVCFVFFSLAVLCNYPEAIHLCYDGVPANAPPPTFTAFETFICHKSTECPSKEDSTEYIIAGIFLVLMVRPSFSFSPLLLLLLCGGVLRRPLFSVRREDRIPPTFRSSG